MMAKLSKDKREMVSFVSVVIMLGIMIVWMFMMQVDDNPNMLAYATGANPTPTVTPLPTPTSTPRPFNYCCQKAVEDFNFDNSHGAWYYCVFNSSDCTTTGQCAEAKWILNPNAQALADQISKDWDKNDALRHTIWSLMMTEAFSSCTAKQIADAYEVDEPNACNEMYKDLYNNQVGRSLANQPGTIEERVRNALSSGLIHTVEGC
ncbi:MAG: hypothetical protein AB1656_22635 [Candidatus Omnitrophota bacterium]